LSNNLVVQGLANVSATNATYKAATISVTGGESINVQRSTLTATGDLTLSASKTISAAQAGPLGATANANAAVTVVDTTLAGQNIKLLATSTLTANSGADSSNDTLSKDFARVTSGSTAQVSVAGTSRVNASGNVLIQSVVTDTTSALAQ